MPPSRASPLPQVFASSAEFDSGTEPVGVGLARDEVRPDAAKTCCNAGINPLFTLSLWPTPRLALVPLQPPSRQSLHTRQYAVTRRSSMSVLDGVSLLLAVGLFIYLLVALLRADRN
jgi:K+-transporting ATPase ATPase F chain